MIFGQVLEICKLNEKFSNTNKERSQNKLNQVEEFSQNAKKMC